MIQIKKSSTYFSLFFLNCLKKNNFIFFDDGTNVGNCPSDAHTEMMLGYANSILLANLCSYHNCSVTQSRLKSGLEMCNFNDNNTHLLTHLYRSRYS